MEVRLRAVLGPYNGQTILLGPGRYSVGRGRTCAVRLTRDQGVSGRHAILTVRAGGLVVEDRGSRNGTFVNDARLAVPTAVADGDRLRIGTSVFEVSVAVTPGGEETPETSGVAAEEEDTLPFEELPARLQILDGDRLGEIVEIPPDQVFMVGRGQEATLVLPDPFCSREHIALLSRAGRVVVRDNGSRNGLLVNDQRVQALQLAHDDVITIGRTRLRFIAAGRALPDDPQGDAPVAAPDPAMVEGSTDVPPEEAARSAGDDQQPVGRFGHYLLLREIGRGGMGRVFEARTPGHARVALKLLRTKGVDEERLALRRRRFEREARVLHLIRHENVVAFREAGVVAGQPFLAMERLEGPDLVSEMRFDRRLPYPEVERILFQLCAAVSAVHEAGVVHRDLKPGNVVLHGPARVVKLTDFGIAKLLDDRDLEGDEERLGSVDASAEITPEGRHPGTPFYMSPEQVRGETLDMRSDIWALGVVLYQLVAGGRPFEGRTGKEVMDSIVADCPRPLPDTVPPYVRSAVYRCLLKPPSWRFASAIELMDALHDRRVEQPTPVGADGPPPVPLTQCPFCGAAIAVGRDKCTLCRTDLNVFLEGHLYHLPMGDRLYAVCGSCGLAVSPNAKVCRRCGRLFKARQTAADSFRDETLTEDEIEELVHALVKLRACPYCRAPVPSTRPQCLTCGLPIRAFLAGRIVMAPDSTGADRAHCGNCQSRLPDPGQMQCASCGLNFVTGRMRDGKPWRRPGRRRGRR